MLDNFIRGGQIFLHNLAMFKQVMGKTFVAAFILAIMIAGYLSLPKFTKVDFHASISYVKAGTAKWIHNNRLILHDNAKDTIPKIDAHDNRGLYAKGASAVYILKHPKFKNAYELMISSIKSVLFCTVIITGTIFFIIFLIWIKFGKSAKETKMLDGTEVLDAARVRHYLKTINGVGFINVDGMPLIKDQETRHILITGMTGSGKTNLINKILPQVRKANEAAVVLDQTGEMISRYYDEARGDIIFNPLDARSKSWDFWTDCSSGTNEFGINEKLEKFAKVLIGGNRKNLSYGSDPFWENSAEIIFIACVEYLVAKESKSISDLQNILQCWSIKDFKANLEGTKAAKYLNAENSATASSIISVMGTSCRPLFYLNDKENKDKFSLRQYFDNVAKGSDGSNAWLFLATPPDGREVIMPLLNCVLELAMNCMIATGINEKRRIWFVIDELAALGKLSSFNSLMTEGRKYGACVLAALQSYNQLMSNYGQYLGSTLFGQFATKFIFRTNEPPLAKLMSDMFGSIEYRQHQKNTSYGAHEHRDGISYTEQEKRKPLIESNKFMELATHECFVALPDPKIKLAKIQLKGVADIPIKHQGFVPLSGSSFQSMDIGAKKVIDEDNQLEKLPVNQAVRAADIPKSDSGNGDMTKNPEKPDPEYEPEV